jgi:NADPH-dependent 2,4-dienoyl-CoA reductase/sulfur reductase-like enzyme
LFDREKLKREGRVLSCTVNPELLREREFILKPAGSKKKVMVIGGGLAGMEAARVLAQRGHQVNLYEREDRLGGQWNIAYSQADKGGFKTALDYLLAGLKKSGAKVILNKEVTVGFVKGEKPDAVVLATGSRPAVLNVPGVNGKNVIQAIDIFAGKARVVGDVIAVIGGRLRGMEVAHMLAQEGKRVSVITMNRLGENGSPLERNVYFEIRQRLIDDRVTIYALSRVVEVRENGVYIDCDRELTFVPADTVVLAVGAEPENGLLNELKGIVSEVFAIGDCAQPRYAKEAINEGAEIGRLI